MLRESVAWRAPAPSTVGLPFDCGVPFGQKRIVPIVLPTLAVQNKTQMIRFRTAAEM